MLFDGIQGVGNLANANNSFWAQFGNGDPAGMSGATSMGVNYLSMLQAAGFNPDGSPRLSVDPVNANGYRSTNYSFNNGPGYAFGAGGLGGPGASTASQGTGTASQSIYSSGFEGTPWAGASGSSATSGGLAGTSSGFGPSSLGLSGASGASGSAGAGLGMGGATSGATGASGGFWGAAKGVLGNKAIMSGIVTGLSSAYGQYQQKNAAKDAYKWQSKELEAQRAYQRELYERKQNSPAAKMSRALLQYYMPIYIEKLKKHNKGADTSALDQLLASMSGGV